MTPFDLSTERPAATFSLPAQAMWWLKKGNLAVGPEWSQAHAICQQDEGHPEYDLVHALVHWIEGDESNTAYWYRRVPGDRAKTVKLEWERIWVALGG